MESEAACQWAIPTILKLPSRTNLNQIDWLCRAEVPQRMPSNKNKSSTEIKECWLFSMWGPRILEWWLGLCNWLPVWTWSTRNEEKKSTIYQCYSEELCGIRIKYYESLFYYHDTDGQTELGLYTDIPIVCIRFPDKCGFKSPSYPIPCFRFRVPIPMSLMSKGRSALIRKLDYHRHSRELAFSTDMWSYNTGHQPNNWFVWKRKLKFLQQNREGDLF